METRNRRPADPPQAQCGSGTRRVGVEIEFGDLGGERAAELVHALFGGVLRQVEPFTWKIEATRFGTFTVELDWHYVHLLDQDTLARARAGSPSALLKQGLTKAMGAVGARIMPYEVAAPPIPYDRLGALEDLIVALREHGAHGTRADLLYAFALQLNPEAPSLEARDILALFRAYLLMSDWLRREIDIDLTRRISPMVDRFPEDYARGVLDPAYAPTLAEFIEDYLDANPTRNRELDLLPLFAHLDRERVRGRVRDRLVQPRPAYHYRLPDCRLDDPEWGVLVEWARWVEVERLARAPDRLVEMSERFLHRNGNRNGSWADIVEEYL